PLLIQKIVYNHLDKRLNARHEKMLRMIRIGGLNEIALDQDCSFDSYNIFKEEYVSISPLSELPEDFGKVKIEDSERSVDEEEVKHRVLSQAFIYDNQIYRMEIGEGLSSADALKSSIRSFTFKVMLAIVLFSILIDLGFAQVLLRPFNLIVNRKLRNVTHPSGFDTTPVSTNTTEFLLLDRSINEMMSRIQEELRMEREFITNVSHELLTPISILQNRVENMINDPGVPEETVNRLVESQKTLARLARIIKALLQISRIENEQYSRSESASIQM
ncbi:MAG: histidine kinase dimerization/phospho-acceptor domain-containing protein, partial [Flavobacteriales bacterium]